MKEKIKSLYANKGLRLSLYIVGALFVFSAIFQLGIFVGYHKANFARDWSESYGKNFGMERPDSFRGMMGDELPMPHGSVGKILTVTLPNIIIEDRDGTEQNIIVSDKTLIKSGPTNASSTSLKADDLVVILGEPNSQGQIEAKLIRIMPAFSTSTKMMGGLPGEPFTR